MSLHTLKNPVSGKATFSFYNDDDTGLHSSAANSISLMAGGVTVNTFTASASNFNVPGSSTNLWIGTGTTGITNFYFGTTTASFKIDDSAILDFTAAAATAGSSTFMECQKAGTSAADTAGAAGGSLTLTAGAGAAGGAHTSNNPAGGNGGSLTLVAGAGGAAGSGGSGAAGQTGSIIQRGGLLRSRSATTEATAGNATYTAAAIKGGIILRDPAGGNRTDVMPTAALLVAAFPGVAVGDSVQFLLVNNADANETITIAGGTGITYGMGTNLSLAQNTSRVFEAVFTNVTASSEAVTLY